MASFLSVVGAVAVQRAAEKGLFGKPYVRLGRVFIMIGNWLYQQGAALGYGLREEPALLGKLLGASPAKAAEYIESLREKVASRLREAEGREKTFRQLYLSQELQRLGIDITAWPPSKVLERKMDPEFVSEVMRMSFHEGAGLGYHFPDIFKEYWEHHYRMRPDTEWHEMRVQGLALPETQDDTPLEGAVTWLAEAAVAWAAEEAPTLLDAHEGAILNQLAASPSNAA